MTGESRQATTSRHVRPYGRRESLHERSDPRESVRRAAETASRLKTFNGDWSAISLKAKTVHNASGQSTDYEG